MTMIELHTHSICHQKTVVVRLNQIAFHSFIIQVYRNSSQNRLLSSLASFIFSYRSLNECLTTIHTPFFCHFIRLGRFRLLSLLVIFWLVMHYFFVLIFSSLVLSFFPLTPVLEKNKQRNSVNEMMLQCIPRGFS